MGEHLNLFRASIEAGTDAPVAVYTSTGKTFTSVHTAEGVMVDHVPAKLSLTGAPADQQLPAAGNIDPEDSDDEGDEDETNDDDDYDALDNLENDEKFRYDSPLDHTCPLLYLKSVLEGLEKVHPQLFSGLMGTLNSEEVQKLVSIVQNSANYVQLVEQRRREQAQSN